MFASKVPSSMHTRAPSHTNTIQALEASRAYHETRSPTDEDKGACAELAQGLADASDEAEEALEVGSVVMSSSPFVFWFLSLSVVVSSLERSSLRPSRLGVEEGGVGTHG